VLNLDERETSVTAGCSPEVGEAPRWLDHDDIPRFSDVNRQPFGFRHSLHRGLKLDLAAVQALAGRLPDTQDFKVWQNGDVALDSSWETAPDARRSFDDTLANIATSNSVVVLKHVEQDPVFGTALRELLQEIFDCSSSTFRNDVVIGECLVFVNSPRRATVYHFDLEPSFLLQVEGKKTAYAWPCNDPTLLTHEEIEDHCGTGNASAGRYKPERAGEARVFDLAPGDAVHFPSCGPHWVQNGDEVSISINVNFDTRSVHHRLQYAYAVNHRLRRLGFNTNHPGQHPLLDSAKAVVWSNLRRMRRLSRQLAGRRSEGEKYPTWKPVR
jgi:hypothetical protein